MIWGANRTECLIPSELLGKKQDTLSQTQKSSFPLCFREKTSIANTINKINSNISRHCAIVPNVYLAHHPDLDTDCLYDHVHIYKNLVHILQKDLKSVTLNRTNQTSPRWSRTSPDPAKPTRHASRNSIPPALHLEPHPELQRLREEPHRQRLTLQKAPTLLHRWPHPSQRDRANAQAVSGGVTRPALSFTTSNTCWVSSALTY